MLWRLQGWRRWRFPSCILRSVVSWDRPAARFLWFRFLSLLRDGRRYRWPSLFIINEEEECIIINYYGGGGVMLILLLLYNI